MAAPSEARNPSWRRADRPAFARAVAYVAERAAQLVQAELDAAPDDAADRARLEAIADELANLIRLAAKTGASDAIARSVTALEAERATIEARLGSRPGPLDLHAIRREIDLMMRDLRTLLEGGQGRAVLKRLLGDERLRVRPDTERGFAVEGEFSWLVGSGSEPCSGSVERGFESPHHRALTGDSWFASACARSCRGRR